MAADDRRAINEGYGDALTRAVEIAVIPPMFGVAGWWLDGRFGTAPWLMVAAVAYSVIGLAVRAWYGYRRQLDAEVPEILRDRPGLSTQVSFEVPPVDRPEAEGSAA